MLPIKLRPFDHAAEGAVFVNLDGAVVWVEGFQVAVQAVNDQLFDHRLVAVFLPGDDDPFINHMDFRG
jgi:hypothetical protein